MTASPAWRSRAAEILSVLARWILGALFVYLGAKKALHPVDFLKLVRQYNMVDTPFMLNSVASALPWFEVFCGALLLLGIAVRGTALTLVLVLIPFTALVLHRALILEAARSIPFCAVKFDCGCGNGEEFICGKLGENIALILLSCRLLLGRGRAFCLRYGLL